MDTTFNFEVGDLVMAAGRPQVLGVVVARKEVELHCSENNFSYPSEYLEVKWHNKSFAIRIYKRYGAWKLLRRIGCGC